LPSNLVHSAIDFIETKKVAVYEATSAAFFSYMPAYFSDKVLLLNKIRSEIANKYSIGIQSVVICGSAQIGYSYIKGRKFNLGESDLDVAIISTQLFARYYDIALEETQGFRNQTKFDSPRDRDRFFDLLKSKGMLMPELGPAGQARTLWNSYFNSLTEKYKSHFSKVSAAIYLSERAYLMKQQACVEFARKDA